MTLIDTLQTSDWPSIQAIYLEGIQTKNATFETAVPTWEEWDNRHLASCRLVARSGLGSAVLGWAALSPYSHRRVYAGVAEVSIYISAAARGQGIGKLLLTRLIELSEMEGFWTLQAGIFPENAASLALHQGCGFRVVGRREHIGQLDGVWRDVLLLERRVARN